MLRAIILVGILALWLPGCSSDNLADRHDPGVDKTREDFEELRRPPESEPETQSRPPRPVVPPPQVPDPASVLSRPAPPELVPNPRITVASSEDVPLKDVLFELARSAGIEIEIDARITGGVVFVANNRPFLDVVRRITRLAGLKYDVVDNVVRIEVDDPYQRNYDLPYLSLARETTSSITINNDVATPGAEGVGGGETSSSSSISGSATTDFYEELQTALEAILVNTAPRGPGGGETAEQAVALHRQAGIVSVFGTDRQQEAVRQYLVELRRSVYAQVLIEAKVVEVRLEESFSSGVDWRAVLGSFGTGGSGLNVGGGFGEAGNPPPFTDLNDAAEGVVSVGALTQDFDALLTLVEQFGTTRTLSSPRLTVMNNQAAILKVAENQVFFTLDVETEERQDNAGNIIEDRTIDSEIRTLPVGLVLTVQPAINMRQERVTLTLRPTITRVVEFTNDPAVTIASDGQVTSRIPVVETREVDSVLELQSGEVAVLGGLMQDRTSKADTGVPGLAELPWAGRLFKARDEEGDTIELVVFLRAQIIQRPQIGPADRRLYQDFTNDPRPFDLQDGARRSNQR